MLQKITDKGFLFFGLQICDNKSLKKNGNVVGDKND
jgi:hypothetical protein